MNAQAKSTIDSKYGGDAEAYYEEMFLAAARNGDTAGMDAALGATTSSGRVLDKQIAAWVRKAAENGDMHYRDNATRADHLSKMASQYGGGFLAKDFKLRDWMAQGGMKKDENGNFVEESLAEHSVDPTDVKQRW